MQLELFFLSLVVLKEVLLMRPEHYRQRCSTYGTLSGDVI